MEINVNIGCLLKSTHIFFPIYISFIMILFFTFNIFAAFIMLL